MDTRLTATHITRRLLVAAIIAVALVIVFGATKAAAASPTACRVRDTVTGKTYTALQTAVDAAKPGARLIVRGACVGGTVIDRDLAIQGVRNPHSGRPTLAGGGDGAGEVRVIRVNRGVTASIGSLTIRRGFHIRGGGILNRGSLGLRDVVVRENGPPGWWAYAGPGAGAAIYNSGTLSLDGDTAVRDNVPFKAPVYNVGALTMDDTSRISDNMGGSMENDGTVTMNGASSIVGNWEGVWNRGTLTLNGASSIVRNGGYVKRGGGVTNDGSLTMNDSSSISGNGAGIVPAGVQSSGSDGGGVYNRGTLTLTGSSTISGNALYGGPPRLGGGLYNAAGATLAGVTCGPGGNVFGNTPDDCYIEP